MADFQTTFKKEEEKVTKIYELYIYIHTNALLFFFSQQYDYISPPNISLKIVLRLQNAAIAMRILISPLCT